MEIFEKSDSAKRTLNALHKCRDICLELVAYSLIQGGSYSEKGVIDPYNDCAKIAELAENYIHRGSEYRVQAANLCAQICDDAADQSGRFVDDEKMLYASMVIRDCAVTCRDLTTNEHFV